MIPKKQFPFRKFSLKKFRLVESSDWRRLDSDPDVPPRASVTSELKKTSEKCADHVASRTEKCADHVATRHIKFYVGRHV